MFKNTENTDYDFDDATIENLTLDFSNQLLKICISKYNDDIQCYFTHKVIFDGVMRIDFPLPIVDTIDAEIYSFEIGKIENHYSAKIGILLGFRNPSLEVSFEFENVVVEIFREKMGGKESFEEG